LSLSAHAGLLVFTARRLSWGLALVRGQASITAHWQLVDLARVCSRAATRIGRLDDAVPNRHDLRCHNSICHNRNFWSERRHSRRRRFAVALSTVPCCFRVIVVIR